MYACVCARACVCMHVRTLHTMQIRTSSLPFSFDVPGGGRICEGGDCTKCHFGGAVDGRPGEVRCAKEQEQTLFFFFSFFFETKSRRGRAMRHHGEV